MKELNIKTCDPGHLQNQKQVCLETARCTRWQNRARPTLDWHWQNNCVDSNRLWQSRWTLQSQWSRSWPTSPRDPSCACCVGKKGWRAARGRHSRSCRESPGPDDPNRTIGWARWPRRLRERHLERVDTIWTERALWIWWCAWRVKRRWKHKRQPKRDGERTGYACIKSKSFLPLSMLLWFPTLYFAPPDREAWWLAEPWLPGRLRSRTRARGLCSSSCRENPGGKCRVRGWRDRWTRSSDRTMPKGLSDSHLMNDPVERWMIQSIKPMWLQALLTSVWVHHVSMVFLLENKI